MKPILVKTCETVQDHGIKAGRTGTKRFLRLFGQTYCNAECARFLCVCYCIVPQVVAELRKRAAAAVVVAVKNKSDEEAKLAGRAAAQSPQQKEAAKAF
jgi:hypothetical protein